MNLVIVDTQLSNVKSLTEAVTLLSDANVSISNDPEKLVKADKVILPGVGAFSRCMDRLSKSYCSDALGEIASKGVPILGICLGMQILGTESSEFGRHPGLNLIPGSIDALSNNPKLKKNFKKTHIGWSSVQITNANYITAELVTDDYFYFVHSYYFSPFDPSDILAAIKINDVLVPAIVGRNNVFGCQFHPEKSGKSGLNFLNKFLSL